MPHRIEWRHDRRRIVLPVILMSPDLEAGFVGIAARALLDTGATITGVTARVADALCLRPLGKRPIGSAQGEGQAERYVLRVGLDLPGDTPSFPYVFERVQCFELNNSFTLDALIGMDILSQCDFSMDRGGVCALSFG